MDTKGFRTGLVSRLVGLSYKQIDHYDRCGLVPPEIQKAAGRGSRRLYSRTDLIELLVIRRLLDNGISLRKIRNSLAEIRKSYPDIARPLSDLDLSTDGSSVYAYDPATGQPLDLLHPDQPVIPVALEKIARHVDRKIQEFENHHIEPLAAGGRTYLLEIVNDTESQGVIARCPELLGISTKGASLEEALDKMRGRIKDALDQIGGKKA